MNCHELHTHFENNPHVDAGIPAEMAAHAAGCVQCAEFVEEQIALQESLRLARESLVPVPESLDARVLGGFRAQMSTPKPIRSFPRTISILRWSAAIAAALLLAAILYTTARKPVVSTVQPALPQPAAQAVPAVQPMVAPVRAQATPAANHSRRAADRRTPAHPALASNQHSDPAPGRFHSLMYCDELACAAPMDVIRVQLPSDFVARPARGLASTGNAVTADVLIGSDGIARGIRIVE